MKLMIGRVVFALMILLFMGILVYMTPLKVTAALLTVMLGVWLFVRFSGTVGSWITWLHKYQELTVYKKLQTASIREIRDYWKIHGNIGKEVAPDDSDTGIEYYAQVYVIGPDGQLARSPNGGYLTHTYRIYCKEEWAQEQGSVTPHQLRGIRKGLEEAKLPVENVYYRIGNSDLLCFDRKMI